MVSNNSPFCFERKEIKRIRFDNNTLNAQMVRGDTGTFTIRPTDASDNAILKAGDQVAFTIRKNLETPVLLERTVSEIQDGMATIKILPEDTKNMELGSYLYDLKLIRKDGNIDTLIPNNPYAWFTLKEGVRHE